MSEFFEAIENGIKEYWLWLLAILVLYFIFTYNLQYGLIRQILDLAGTILLGRIAYKLWMHYIQQDFISGIDFVLLEIVPPRDVLRSPKAMELFFTNALYQYSHKGGKETYWQGAVWFWFSLEIASIDGQVHFYVRTPTRVKGLIETQMYAQYPQAQIKVVEDYTLAVDEISPESSWMGWGTEWELKKPEAYPLKTYVDYELDKDPKEEYKIDPISPVIELFGSIQKGEQMWMQIVITPSKVEYKNKGSWFGTHNWIQESKEEIVRMLAPYTNTRVGAKDPTHFSIEMRAPRFLDPSIEKMSQKTTKLGFNTGIRVMYVAKKEVFDMNSRRNIRLIFRQYANPDSNSLRRTNATQADAYSGFFALSKEKVMVLANRMLTEYRERAFFHHSLRQQLLDTHKLYMHWPVSSFVLAYKHQPTFVLNTEELATLWHFPGQILKVPTLTRIESKEAAPPPNLPI